MIFEDRKEAGKLLAARLKTLKLGKPIILALPRGGVPTGYEIAEVLNLPFYVFVARKIGSPENPEFGIGSIAEGNVLILERELINNLHISQKQLKEIINLEKEELKRRVFLYRNNQPIPSLKNKIVILVDDGLATGITARAAIQAIKKQNPKNVIFASPVCAYDTAEQFFKLVDNVVCITIPGDFSAVGLWYRHFEQVTDEEVIDLLHKNQMQHLYHSREGNSHGLPQL